MADRADREVFNLKPNVGLEGIREQYLVNVGWTLKIGVAFPKSAPSNRRGTSGLQVTVSFFWWSKQYFGEIKQKYFKIIDSFLTFLIIAPPS